MKNYLGLFGRYSIRVKAKNEKEAKRKIIEKWAKYKDGSDKKEHIRDYILHNNFTIVEAIKIKGLWLPKE